MSIEINSTLLSKQKPTGVEHERTANSGLAVKTKIASNQQDSVAISTTSLQLIGLSKDLMSEEIVDGERVTRAKQALKDGTLGILSANLNERTNAAAKIAAKLMEPTEKD